MSVLSFGSASGHGGGPAPAAAGERLRRRRLSGGGSVSEAERLQVSSSKKEKRRGQQSATSIDGLHSSFIHSFKPYFQFKRELPSFIHPATHPLTNHFCALPQCPHRSSKSQDGTPSLTH